MEKVSVRTLLTTVSSACIVFNLFLGIDAIAQELSRPPPPGTWAVSSEARADALQEYYDFVVLGEFIDDPGDAAGDLSMNGPRVVVIPFAVSRVFKTYFPLPDTIHIQLDADMLRYPGESISRFGKRDQFWEEYTAWLKDLDRQIAELREAQQNGFITVEEFRQKQTDLLGTRDTVASDVGNIPVRGVAVLHGESFYDAGGAIGPGEEYVLGLEISRENPNTFVLAVHEYSSVKNVFWGPMRDEIAGLLDRAMNP